MIYISFVKNSELWTHSHTFSHLKTISSSMGLKYLKIHCSWRLTLPMAHLNHPSAQKGQQLVEMLLICFLIAGIPQVTDFS